MTGFLGRGLWGRPAAAVMDTAGYLRWSYKAADPTAASRPGFVWMGGESALAIVTHDGTRGLMLVDPYTRQVRGRIPMAGLWNFATVDLTGDGQNEIITVDDQATLTAWDANGAPRASKELDFHYSEPTVLRAAKGRVKLALSSPSAIHLFDENLNRVSQIEIPLPRSFRLRAADVTDCGEGESCLVSLFHGRGGWHRTILFVHSLKGDLLWHEILGDDFQSVMPHPDAIPGGWGFLIGGRGEVREYRRG